LSTESKACTACLAFMDATPLLQTIYNVKWTFTQKQIPRQNEKCNLLSANKESVKRV